MMTKTNVCLSDMPQYVKFSELEGGDKFYWGGALYMKVRDTSYHYDDDVEHGDPYNAVSLLCGSEVLITKEQIVIPVNLTITSELVKAGYRA